MASPMQFCMETSDWLKQAIIPDEGAADVLNSSSSPSGELTPCPLLRPPSGPMALERRLRPPHDRAQLKCPRCDSGHTKFCYYNNYSLSQPRYFCKACRRYWTKGGSLRNVPIGGGCRKNKRPAASSSKNKQPPTAADQIQSIIHHHHQQQQQQKQMDLGRLSGLNFMFDSIPGCSHFATGLDLGLGDHNVGSSTTPIGYSIDEACQRLAMPFGEADVKPGNRMLSLEWPDQLGCGGDSFGYSNGSSLGLWAGMINGHGP